jgi:FAD/FMN-containing dehydrogenase
MIEELQKIVGLSHVVSGEDAAPFCSDWRGRYSGSAVAVVFPANTEQVSAAIKLCVEHRVAIVPQGGNTSLCGASVPLDDNSEQVVINLSRMNRIISLDADNYTMTVEAGCKLASVYEAAEKQNRLFPLGLTAIAPHCEIGGNLSTNAGGIGVLRYGSARDLVLGLEVVLPDGRIWNGLRSLRKDNTGYDLKHLFMGAEGTLGIITAAVLKLYPLPRQTATACVAIANPIAAVRLLAHIKASCGDTLSAFELISRSSLDLVFEHIPNTREPFAKPYDWQLIIKLSDSAQNNLAQNLRVALTDFTTGKFDFVVTDDDVVAEQWWRLRKNISEAQKCEGTSIKHDVSIPISHVAEFIIRAEAELRKCHPQIRIVAFGHLGDGNIHYNVSISDAEANKAFIEQHESEVNRRVYEIVTQLGGSISAEHGLGQLKRKEITCYKSEVELDLMRSIKHTFDPHGLMNPGKVI